jgi:uncharacterized membrane protein YhaH (DUF805 family)
MPSINLRHLYFSTDGRISRQTWWIGIGGLLVLNIVLFMLLWSLIGASLILNFFGRLIWFAATLLAIAMSYHLAAKRFHDRNRSELNAKVVAGGWALKALLDLFHITGDPATTTSLDTAFLLAGTAAALWYFLELGCMPGTTGANDHGADPLESTVR